MATEIIYEWIIVEVGGWLDANGVLTGAQYVLQEVEEWIQAPPFTPNPVQPPNIIATDGSVTYQSPSSPSLVFTIKAQIAIGSAPPSYGAQLTILGTLVISPFNAYPPTTYGFNPNTNTYGISLDGGTTWAEYSIPGVVNILAAAINPNWSETGTQSIYMLAEMDNSTDAGNPYYSDTNTGSVYAVLELTPGSYTTPDGDVWTPVSGEGDNWTPYEAPTPPVTVAQSGYVLVGNTEGLFYFIVSDDDGGVYYLDYGSDWGVSFLPSDDAFWGTWADWETNYAEGGETQVWQFPASGGLSVVEILAHVSYQGTLYVLVELSDGSYGVKQSTDGVTWTLTIVPTPPVTPFTAGVAISNSGAAPDFTIQAVSGDIYRLNFFSGTPAWTAWTDTDASNYVIEEVPITHGSTLTIILTPGALKNSHLAAITGVTIYFVELGNNPSTSLMGMMEYAEPPSNGSAISGMMEYAEPPTDGAIEMGTMESIATAEGIGTAGIIEQLGVAGTIQGP